MSNTRLLAITLHSALCFDSAFVCIYVLVCHCFPYATGTNIVGK